MSYLLLNHCLYCSNRVTRSTTTILLLKVSYPVLTISSEQCIISWGDEAIASLSHHRNLPALTNTIGRKLWHFFHCVPLVSHYIFGMLLLLFGIFSCASSSLNVLKFSKIMHSLLLVTNEHILVYIPIHIPYSEKFSQDKIFVDGSKNENLWIKFSQMLATVA